MNKQPRKSEKYTQKGKRKAAELEAIRMEIRFDKNSFASILGLPYRTYQDYAYGLRATPDDVLVKAREALRKDRILMSVIGKELHRDLDRRYPHGIPSTPLPAEE